jgi:WD40 repeat protein
VGVVIETPAGNVTLWTAKGAVGRPWKPDDILNGAEPLPNGAGFVALGYKSVYVHQGATTRSVELDEHSIDSRNNRPFVSPRGDVLAFVDDVNDVEVWRIRDLKHMCTKHPAGVFSGAAFSGNGALFALSSSAGLELFRDGPCGRPDVVATRPLEGVAFPSHGRALLAWDRNEATVLDTAVPARRIALKRANGMEHVAFDSTGCRLAASSFGPDVDVWDLCSVQWRAPQQLRSSFLADGAFDQTGRIAYLTFEDEAVLWRSQRSEHQALWHSQKGGIWGVGSTFSSGGLFAFYDGARKVNVLDMTTMKPLASPELALIWPSSIALGGDGSWIAGLHRAPDSWHNEISVLDLASGARLNGIEASDAKIAAHPIEPWIGISDVQLRLWNWRDDRTVELAAQGTESGPLAFSRNGSALAATRADRVYVWHFADGPSAARGDDKPVATPLLRYVYSVQWSWDGRFIATSSAQGVDVWDAASALPVWHIAGNRPLAAAFVSPSEIVSVWSDKSDNILRQDTCDACRAPDALVALAHERLRGGAASSDHFSP